jgi:putative endonuclease
MAGTDRPFGPGLNKPAQPKRQAALQFGLSAESWAVVYLLLKGYRILARRFKTPVGEIDIVARRRGTLVFVEVKARRNFDDAAEALTERQQARIINAAQYWLAAHPEAVECPIRFDAILVAPGKFPQHLPAAFDATERGG